MGDQVVLGYFTHRKSHSPFYEGDHGNNDLPLPSKGMPLTQRAILQGAPQGI